jgi:uncharacterized protein YfaS (alpha-2-macroglobulin family)
MTRERSLLVVAVLSAAVCTLGTASGERSLGGGAVVRGAGEARGLVFRLSEAEESPGEAAAVIARPPAERLSDAEIQPLLDRLPEIQGDEAEARPFAIRPDSLPPPRTGRTNAAPFPPHPDVDVPKVAPAALVVERHAPDGPVPLAPHLEVTFSVPMVALTSQNEAARTKPVRLAPEPPGQWRWVGTRTLLFEPSGRFPMATDYRVEVAAGTRSVTGALLERPVAWTFSTPPPKLLEGFPTGGPARRDALMAAALDQRVDPGRLLSHLRAEAGGRPTVLRLATSEQVAADEAIKAFVSRHGADRSLVFLTQEPLPSDTEVTVRLGAGAPSAEGPKTTVAEQSFRFRTYGPLRVLRQRCGSQKVCHPFAPWEIEFSNPLEAGAFRPEMVRVEPPSPGQRVEVFGSTLRIWGSLKGRTTYRVTLAETLTDSFGQTLGVPTTAEFQVGQAPTALSAPGGSFVVLDPAGLPRLSVFSTNHEALKLQLYSVTPEDWAGFQSYLTASARDGDEGRPPGRQVLSTRLSVAGAPDDIAETRIDLSPALHDGLGQVVVVVEPLVQPKERCQRQDVRVWVQATRIGLDAYADREQLVAWATDLADGRPLGDVTLSLGAGGAAIRTGADRLAALPLPDQAVPALVARRGGDVALLPRAVQGSPSSGWSRSPEAAAFLWYVTDDRGVYRPGEEVHVKGFLRKMGRGPRGEVSWSPGSARQLAWAAKDSHGNEVARGSASVGALGGFDLAFKLGPTVSLGTASLALEALPPQGSAGPESRSYEHPFEVQEFRRPEFEVTADASGGPHLVGGFATVTSTASYYAGGPLPGADLTWQVTARPARFTPPNRDRFAFGSWEAWWAPHQDPRTMAAQTLTAKTDARGHHRLRVDFDRATPPRATSLRTEVRIQDVNRQTWAATSTLLVHPASVYVGLRSLRPFVRRGEEVDVELIATDLEGAAVPGRDLTVIAERLEWQRVGTEWREAPTHRQECRTTSMPEPGRCSFSGSEGGEWRIVAEVQDEQGRRNESEIHVFVGGGSPPPPRGVESEEVRLIPDRQEYRGGDTAEVLVLSPFAPARGLLTLERDGVVSQERFSIDGASHTLRIPIDPVWTPNVHLRVDLVGAAPRVTEGGRPLAGAPHRPAFATGALTLAIPPLHRRLTIDVTPRQTALEPGGSTEVTLEVKDAAGLPAPGAEVALAVVDEAVLALSDHKWWSPLDTFYPRRAEGVGTVHLRQSVLLARTADLRMSESEIREALSALGYTRVAPAALDDIAEFKAPAPQVTPLQRLMAGGQASYMAMSADLTPGLIAPIAVRADFNPTAVFLAALTTGPDGRAHATVKLPESLTRYRIMAIAVAGEKHFGAGEATLTARLPLMVRPSPPRFLNLGDRFELPVVIQNQTGSELPVDVAVRARNASLLEGAGRRVRVPAHDRVEVRFPTTTHLPGRARFQLAASSGSHSDAAAADLPVFTPATAEAFASYGQIDAGAIAQPVLAPAGALPGFGALEITTSSTALSALTDAVLYLVAYPFECAEQLSSRVLAVVALKDVLAAFRTEGLPAPEALAAAADRDIARLRALQNDDGGFAFWRRGDPSWPYVSIHVAHALVRARQKGFKVPDDLANRSREHLSEIEDHIPSWYSPEARRTLIAYALNVRQQLGSSDPGRARGLIREAGVTGLSFEALGWLLPVLEKDAAAQADVSSIRRHLANRTVETAGTAHFAVWYRDGTQVLLQSDRRADAVVLEALIATDPANNLIPKLVAGLLAHRQKGRWSNTQENAFVLLAMDRYFRAFERVSPDFLARAWLAETLVSQERFLGHTADRGQVKVPIEALDPHGPVNLTLAKEGTGRLYYRIGLRYAPADLRLEPKDRGFTVTRRYQAVDQADDVRQDPDGLWHVRAGSRVRVHLTMVTPSRRYHVALVDALPAGFEAQNPALKTTGSLPEAPDNDVTVVGAPGLGGPGLPGAYWWWTRTWFEHQNLRDERVEAFASLLWEGVWEYGYLARATTPGLFVVPPPRAEEMYSPETFGRGGTDWVRVE